VARRAWNNRSSNPEAYHKALKEYERVLRRKQRSSWRDFCSCVEGMKPTARLHKLLAKDESYQIGGLRLPSGDFTASDQEVVDHLLETQFSCLSANYRGSFKSAGEDGIFPALLKN
jgi:hypothetical protein